MKKRNLLIDEYPLLVLPSLATCIGLNEAIALQQLHYWIENPKGGIEIDGIRWVYNTYEQWQSDNFPFWSVRTVNRVFNNLEKMGLVVSMQKATYDRKKYYRVHYDNLAAWTDTNCHNADLQDGAKDDDKMEASLTETTTETPKDKLIKVIAKYGFSVFGNDMTHWWNLQRRLKETDIILSGDENKVVVSGLSQKQGNFTEAEIMSDKYSLYFKRAGLELEFRT